MDCEKLGNASFNIKFRLLIAFNAAPFVNKFSATTTTTTTATQQFSLVSLGSVRSENFPPLIDFLLFLMT